MISNYLFTIGKYLSPSQREEVLKEIESNLYDYLEENYGKKAYTDTELEMAFKSMGHPKKVAEAYMNSPRCLIGPAYIDTYWMVLKIALIGAMIGLTISNFIAMSDSNELYEIITTILIDLWQTSLSTFGFVTVIFALIQYHSPAASLKTFDDWSIKDLEVAPSSHERVSNLELIIESIFLCLTLVILNQSTPILAVSIKDKEIIQIFNIEAFKSFLIWINIILSSNLILNFYLLVKGSWQKPTRIIAIILDLIGLGFFAFIIKTPNLWAYHNLSDVLELTLSITLAIVVIIVAIDVIGHVRHLKRDGV